MVSFDPFKFEFFEFDRVTQAQSARGFDHWGAPKAFGGSNLARSRRAYAANRNAVALIGALIVFIRIYVQPFACLSSNAP